jgi:flavin reductase (DIM6/NTAB) family NADH-FMN oxidoreductase RutF
VNILASDQTSLSRQFARAGGAKFIGVDWHRAPSGSPIIDGAVVWIDCELEAEIQTGDHVLVLGRVLDLDPFSAL